MGSSIWKRSSRLLAVLGAAGLLSACAMAIRPAPPARKGPLRVKVVQYRPTLNDVVLGTYRVPNSAFAVLARKPSKSASAFGLLGAAFAQGSGESAAERLVAGHEALLRLGLAARVRRAVRRAVEQGHGPRDIMLRGTGAETLVIKPYVYLVSMGGTHARLYLYLKTSLLNRAGSEKWWTRYIAYVPEQRALRGPNGWFADRGRALDRAIDKAATEAVRVLFTDLKGPGAHWTYKPATITARFATGQIFTLRGEIFKQTKRIVLFSPKLHSFDIIYGVDIMPADQVKISTH